MNTSPIWMQVELALYFGQPEHNQLFYYRNHSSSNFVLRRMYSFFCATNKQEDKNKHAGETFL